MCKTMPLHSCTFIGLKTKLIECIYCFYYITRYIVPNMILPLFQIIWTKDDTPFSRYISSAFTETIEWLLGKPAYSLAHLKLSYLKRWIPNYIWGLRSSLYIIWKQKKSIDLSTLRSTGTPINPRPCPPALLIRFIALTHQEKIAAAHNWQLHPWRPLPCPRFSSSSSQPSPPVPARPPSPSKTTAVPRCGRQPSRSAEARS